MKLKTINKDDLSKILTNSFNNYDKVIIRSIVLKSSGDIFFNLELYELSEIDHAEFCSNLKKLYDDKDN